MKTFLPIILILLFSSSCKKDYPLYDGPGKKPVYTSYSSLSDIKNTPALAVTNSGTIFLRDSLLFMLEQKEGIHVFNVSDSANPVNLTFIQIPAVNDFTISGNNLYADNGPNLVTINISNLYGVVVLNTEQNVFQPLLYPLFYEGYFECADINKGVVIKWVDTVVTNAKCQII